MHIQFLSNGRTYRCVLCNEEFDVLKMITVGSILDNPMTKHVKKHLDDSDDKVCTTEIVTLFELPPKKLSHEG